MSKIFAPFSNILAYASSNPVDLMEQLVSMTIAMYGVDTIQALINQGVIANWLPANMRPYAHAFTNAFHDAIQLKVGQFF